MINKKFLNYLLKQKESGEIHAFIYQKTPETKRARKSDPWVRYHPFMAGRTGKDLTVSTRT
jgi:hypothetical protein